MNYFFSKGVPQSGTPFLFLCSIIQRTLNMEAKKVCMFEEISCLQRMTLKTKVDEVVWQITHESQIVPLKAKDVEYLYEESVIVKRRFCSFAEDKAERMEWVVREMKRYEPTDKQSFEHVLILMVTSKEHPLIMSELQSLNEIMEGFSPKADIRWGLGVNEDLEEKMFILLVCSKK